MCRPGDLHQGEIFYGACMSQFKRLSERELIVLREVEQFSRSVRRVDPAFANEVMDIFRQFGLENLLKSSEEL